MIKKYIGDKAFYKMVLTVAIPMIIQNGITNFVSLLDNIMVGRLGTEQMSGIAIVNQLIFVYNLAIFGAISGAGIFGAQFFGQGDQEGVRNTHRFKMYICLLLTILGGFVLYCFGPQLIDLYLHEEGETISAEATMGYGLTYLWIMLLGLLPFGIESTYSGTIRECGETMISMIAGVVAVFVNLGLNYILIFGKLGFPVLGVAGAAYATVISRYVQVIIVVAWAHTHADRMPFVEGVYRKILIPNQLVKKIIVKGTPLMVNEILWAAGMAFLMQCYSLRGIDVVAGMNISSTILNLFNIVFMAMGMVVSILVGQLLGAGKMEEARDTDRKLIAFSVFSSALIGGLLVLLAPLFPQMYNTSQEVRELSTSFIRVAAACMPLHGFMHSAYFTLRSGGKTMITFLFDSVYLWVISIPVAFLLSRYTLMPIVPLYLTCQLIDIIKCTVGFILLKKGVWIHNIVSDTKKVEAV